MTRHKERNYKESLPEKFDTIINAVSEALIIKPKRSRRLKSLDRQAWVAQFPPQIFRIFYNIFIKQQEAIPVNKNRC